MLDTSDPYEMTLKVETSYTQFKLKFEEEANPRSTHFIFPTLVKFGLVA